jgi:D-glycero-D-manno-heptose 1,7-bisphosphate phosphatase
MKKAVFLDRDGVINPLVYNPITSEYESPHYTDDFSVYPTVVKSLKRLINQGYYLFIVSNQPSYAKGKTTLDNIKAIEKLLTVYFDENDVLIKKYYYCYHHPDGIVPEYSGSCECRKPGTLFLEDAIKNYNLSVNDCWFVGDRDTDIICGKTIGMKTLLIKNKYSVDKAGNEIPDEYASDISEATSIIISKARNNANIINNNGN